MAEHVVATDAALDLVDLIKGRHGSIMFYQSAGCCDGSAPMCYREDDFKLGDSDVYLGSVGGTPFYMHQSQYDYLEHTQLVLDAQDGQGPAFSLDSVEQKHFVTNFRILNKEE
ncbi:DUF779 domain-containing protein [Oceanobacillus senegalensis]|uniref:DUF779 domain-containing protein n=1 Tax=Oceanobacillus senegalensis TaxID=1936063 RepID=UPI000A30CE64|nr:DUF779 domain-containing protein [Oceanobacillus senegalensis]